MISLDGATLVLLGLKANNTKAEIEVLRKAYSEPHRKYHNLDHINHCLIEYAGVVRQAQDPVGLGVALLYHDFVYDPKAPDNENAYNSANKATDFCRRSGISEICIRNVTKLILSTTHKGPPIGRGGKLMVDIDLAILGRPPEEFWDYERKIREEYDFVPEPAFREGRSKILRGFLDKPVIYHTDFFKNKYEAQARVNLEASIACLKGK